MENSYIDIKNTFEAFDRINTSNIKKVLNEEDYSKNEQTDAVPYSQNDEIMVDSMETAKTQFGADFTDHNNPSPMLYYPADGDITLSGTIPGLNNAKFQFRYKDSSFGCYLWVDSLILNDDNVKKISVVNGVYKNWVKNLQTVEDNKPIGFKQ